MMWVKLTFAPVVRANWLFRTSRFTSSRRAGTVRTLVAVGTPKLASMLATMREAAPRRTVASSALVSSAGAGAGAAVDFAALADAAASAGTAVAVGTAVVATALAGAEVPG